MKHAYASVFLTEPPTTRPDTSEWKKLLPETYTTIKAYRDCHAVKAGILWTLLTLLSTAALCLVGIGTWHAAIMSFKDGVSFLIGGLSVTIFIAGAFRPVVAEIERQSRLYLKINFLMVKFTYDRSGQLAEAAAMSGDEKRKALDRKHCDYMEQLVRAYEV